MIDELLGWSVRWFDTDVRWTYFIGEVRADAGFDGPFGIDRNAWAWVAVDRNGNDYHDSGTY